MHRCLMPQRERMILTFIPIIGRNLLFLPHMPTLQVYKYPFLPLFSPLCHTHMNMHTCEHMYEHIFIHRHCLSIWVSVKIRKNYPLLMVESEKRWSLRHMIWWSDVTFWAMKNGITSSWLIYHKAKVQGEHRLDFSTPWSLHTHTQCTEYTNTHTHAHSHTHKHILWFS